MAKEKQRYAPFIDNWIYFGHLNKYAVIPCYPESISDNMQSNFSTTTALSRSAPTFTYSNSGPRTVRIDLQLHRDMMDDVNLNVSNLKTDGTVLDFKDEDYVDTLVRYLQACALPKYSVYSSGAKAVEPPWVAIKFGNNIFIKGVINSTIDVTYKKPILANHKYACIDVGFTVYEMDPYDAESVAKSGSFRGLTRTFKSGIYRS